MGACSSLENSKKSKYLIETGCIEIDEILNKLNK
jgi:hypothetical protein